MCILNISCCRYRRLRWTSHPRSGDARRGPLNPAASSFIATSTHIYSPILVLHKDWARSWSSLTLSLSLPRVRLIASLLKRQQAEAGLSTIRLFATNFIQEFSFPQELFYAFHSHLLVPFISSFLCARAHKSTVFICIPVSSSFWFSSKIYSSKRSRFIYCPFLLRTGKTKRLCPLRPILCLLSTFVILVNCLEFWKTF